MIMSGLDAPHEFMLDVLGEVADDDGFRIRKNMLRRDKSELDERGSGISTAPMKEAHECWRVGGVRNKPRERV